VGAIVPDAVEHYLAGLNRSGDSVLAAIAGAGAERNLPLVDAEVGALLQVLARSIGATRILEIGTAVGYSGIWLARALGPGGMLLTIEMNADRAQEARANFAKAGVADRATVIVGDAARMVAKVAGPFDLIFQDGDKQLYTPLLNRLVELLRPGGLLVTDNVLWDGDVVPGFRDGSRSHPGDDWRAIADYNETVASHPSLTTAIVPLRDGVSISVKR
jgi:predicted O-methyltransferase YrrM